MKESRKYIEEMTKGELKREVETLRYEYDKLRIKEDIVKMLDRIVTNSDLELIRDYVEKIYKKELEKNWGFFYGMRDNIVDMANNLVEVQNVKELQYLNHVMYYMLLDSEPNAVEGLYTMTDGMKKELLKHLMGQKAV